MQPINSSPGFASLGPSLESFRQGAALADQLQAIEVEGQRFTVQASGQMPTQAGSRSVDWVQGDVDTTGLFMQAFSASFGGRLSAAVAQELGLAPAPGKPLASRLVNQALDMAQTGQQAFAGIDFLTQVAHSASAGGVAFKAVMAELALPLSALSKTDCSAIDSRMQQRLDAATAQGHSPVAASQMADWLRSELAPFAGISASTPGIAP